jgi:hypothetical protein
MTNSQIIFLDSYLPAQINKKYLYVKVIQELVYIDLTGLLSSRLSHIEQNSLKLTKDIINYGILCQ